MRRTNDHAGLRSGAAGARSRAMHWAKALRPALLAGLLAACGAGSGGGGGGGAGSAGKSLDWSRLGGTLDSFVSAANNPRSGTVGGYSFLLYDQTGTLYTRAAGVTRAGPAMTAQSVIPLNSASKMPSAAATLTLVDSLRLNLDVPVTAYLLLGGVVWPLDKAGITMRMLLDHTSGLPGLADRTSPGCLGRQTSTTLRQCVLEISRLKLVSQPGAEFNYGGADYQVAGYIATVLSGQDWQTFFAGAIGQPLGLTTFSYGDAAVTNPRIAGGASSDAADYARILQMVQNGGQFGGKRVLSAASVAELEKNQIQNKPVAFTPFPDGQAQFYPGYGFGLWISSPSLYAPSPGPEFSDPGLDGSTPWFDNGLKYGAVLLIEQDPATGLDMWNAARPIIVGQLGGA
jgi:CubicO group peptidase (beta-lactamase class C family)